MQGDQRKYPRFPTNIETIYFSEDGASADRMYYPGVIVNRSKGGLGMEVSYPHQPPETLWLEGMDGFDAPVPATVRWVQSPSRENQQYQLGLAFQPAE